MDQDLFNAYGTSEPVRPDESFWPSFTDIMMVVVMIFIIASTVLILRNWELVQELRATIEAERAAQQRAETLSEAKLSLEERIAEEQRQIDLLRMRLERAQEAKTAETVRREQLEQRLARLEQRMAELAQALELARGRVGELTAKLEAQRSAYAKLERRQAQQLETLRETESELQQTRQALAKTEEQLRTARELGRQQAEQLAEARQYGSTVEQRLAELEGAYETLRYKYEELIKPARSPQGRPVAVVRYEKRDGEPIYQIRGPGGERLERVSRAALERRLARLQAEYDNNLYVRVVIPEDSGLTYDEAWRFTRDMLTRYDYYYQ